MLRFPARTQSPKPLSAILKTSMELIDLNRVTPDLNAQLAFLIKREFYVTYYKYRKLPYLLIGLVIIFIIALFLPDNDYTVGLKTVTITILLILVLFSILLGLNFLIKKQKRDRWKQSVIQKFLQDDKDKPFKFGFNDDNLFFETETYKSEIKWDYYKYWTESDNSIFIFPSNNIYEAIYYSNSEIGQDNYDKLKQLASIKLKPLTRKNGT